MVDKAKAQVHSTDEALHGGIFIQLPQGEGLKVEMLAEANPFRLLNIPPDSDDQAVRLAYLSLVRQYTPEKSPNLYRHIRQSYERIRSDQRRHHWRWFSSDRGSLQPVVTALAASLQTEPPPVFAAEDFRTLVGDTQVEKSP